MKGGILAIVLALVFVGPATAEPVASVQSGALSGTFLADLPPGPAPGIVCEIDTGVDVNPDTQGALLARLTVGADPAIVDDASPDLHGTHVAEVIAAARNGWGTVGVWPAARVVSVRIEAAGVSRGPRWADVATAVARCLDYRPQVVNISETGMSTPEERSMIARVVAFARERGASVVVGAGNGAGVPEFPADVPGVLAVAAWGPSAGGLCPFSAMVPGILAAQGCGVDAASAAGGLMSINGTSFAAPQVSALLAALRAYRPDLDAAGAEALVTSSARSIGPFSAADAQATFRAAGLAALIAPSPLATARVERRSAERPARPRIIGRWLRGSNLVLRVQRPGGAQRLIWSHPARGVASNRFSVRRSRLSVRAWVVATGRGGARSARTWFTIPAVAGVRPPR